MGIFTYVIIIWVIYKLITSFVTKKGMLQTPRNLSESLKPPEGRLLRNVIQGISLGTWKEQLKQALENIPSQPGSLQLPKPMEFKQSKDYYVETEGTQGMEGTQGVEGIQGVEGTQGTEGTSEYVGILGAEAYKSTEDATLEEIANNRPSQNILSGVRFPVTGRELVQGVMWAEILGKPRAMHPYRGPRTK